MSQFEKNLKNGFKKILMRKKIIESDIKVQVINGRVPEVTDTESVRIQFTAT